MSHWRCFYLGITLLGLQGCHSADLPQYWLCKGNSSQQVELSSGLKEQYHGSGLLLLEIYQGSILQYIAKPFTGNYSICSNSADRLEFELGECGGLVGSGLQTRRGVLDKLSGALQISEISNFLNQTVSNHGEYSCRYLGNQYPASVFYIDDDN